MGGQRLPTNHERTRESNRMKTITIPLPDDWLAKLDAACETNDQKRTEFVRDCLAANLPGPLSTIGPVGNPTFGHPEPEK